MEEGQSVEGCDVQVYQYSSSYYCDNNRQINPEEFTIIKETWDDNYNREQVGQWNQNSGQIEFDDGGIATLPTPEGMQRERVPLTDEQKDYLYDYMLDFMFKQKQREQMEQESIIPPFNYEGLEV